MCIRAPCPPMPCGEPRCVRRQPDLCPAVWQPVCGSDGKTYGNACEAGSADVRIASIGECAPPPPTKCYVGGCGGQLCSDRPDLVSTCEWMPDTRCRRLAECGPFGEGGSCAWSDAPAFSRCIRATNDLTVY
ncbi:MAG: hypothetical protein IPL40_02090 [Proteobacteria bacterium]|nr:hypothetical protein [Pseudomonadota bacterium]